MKLIDLSKDQGTKLVRFHLMQIETWRQYILRVWQCRGRNERVRKTNVMENIACRNSSGNRECMVLKNEIHSLLSIVDYRSSVLRSPSLFQSYPIPRVAVCILLELILDHCRGHELLHQYAVHIAMLRGYLLTCA